MNGKTRWWDEQFADLVERRQPDGTYDPKPKAATRPAPGARTRPEMVAREPGMTRQVQRALYRALCKSLGVPWRKTR
jgi:hypothetical protein